MLRGRVGKGEERREGEKGEERRERREGRGEKGKEERREERKRKESPGTPKVVGTPGESPARASVCDCAFCALLPLGRDVGMTGMNRYATLCWRSRHELDPVKFLVAASP